MFTHETLWVLAEGVVESGLAGGVNGVGLSVMNLVGRHQADSAVMMVAVVPVEETAAKILGLFDGLEAFGEFRLVFQRLEVGFRERIVVGSVGPAVGFGDAEVGQHHGGGLGLHRRATVGVQGQPAGRNVAPGDDVMEQLFEQAGVFTVGDAPAEPEGPAQLRCGGWRCR